jgi:hypothetical protein
MSARALCDSCCFCVPSAVCIGQGCAATVACSEQCSAAAGAHGRAVERFNQPIRGPAAVDGPDTVAIREPRTG